MVWKHPLNWAVPTLATWWWLTYSIGLDMLCAVAKPGESVMLLCHFIISNTCEKCIVKVCYYFQQPKRRTCRCQTLGYNLANELLLPYLCNYKMNSAFEEILESKGLWILDAPILMPRWRNMEKCTQNGGYDILLAVIWMSRERNMSNYCASKYWE